MSEQNFDWTTFSKRITINKEKDVVYKAWATPARLSEWFLEKAGFAKPDGEPRNPDEPVQQGDKYAWKWHNWDVTEEGKILEANGYDKLSFTFGEKSNVHISLIGKGTATEVELIQDKIPTDEKSRMNVYVGCSTGWTFWLANLKAWLEHGIKLNATGLNMDETSDIVNS